MAHRWDMCDLLPLIKRELGIDASGGFAKVTLGAIAK
jgi:hypothetical protein